MPSNSAPGSGRARTPVAITIDSAVTVSSPTWTLCGATTLATPSLELTLYLRNRPSMPLLSWPATPRLRLMIWAKSQPAWPVKPNCLPWFLISSARWALVRSALVGMQPQLRQMPPSLSRSTQSTRFLSWAARIAPA